MKRCLVLVVLVVATASRASEGIHLASNADGRTVSLLPTSALPTTWSPISHPPLRLADGLRFDRSDATSLDTGGGVDSDTRQVLALVMGLLVGFGTGHLIAHDRSDFVLFLIIDVVIISVMFIINGAAIHSEIMTAFGIIALVASHVIQGLDAYHAAGGEKIIQLGREKSTLLADNSGPTASRVSPLFKLSF